MALGLALGAPAAGQDTAPVSSPARSEADARQEAGRLAATLAVRRSEPDALWCRLEVEVPGAGLGKRRVLEVTRLRAAGERSLRVRFREPASLRGRALLLREVQGAPGAEPERWAWRHEPERERAAPIPWPEEDEQLGGAGLRWRDLWGEELACWRYRAEDLGTLALGGGRGAGEGGAGEGGAGVEVLRVRSRARSGDLWRLLHLERRQGLPLLVEEVRPGQERRLIWRSGWRRVGAYWQPSTIRVVSGEELSVIRLREVETSAPAAHLDPSRFQRE